MWNNRYGGYCVCGVRVCVCARVQEDGASFEWVNSWSTRTCVRTEYNGNNIALLNHTKQLCNDMLM